MMAGLKRFLWLWLPALVIMLAGLWRAWLTGQADPWDWGVPMALLLAGAGLLLARRGWAMLTWVAVGGVGMALIFCAFAAGRAPDGMAVLGLFAVALLAVLGGAFIRQHPFVSSEVEKPGANASRLRSKRTGLGVIFLVMAALLLWRGPAQPLQPAPDRPRLAVITGLPLFWSESGQGGPQEAPIVTILRTRFTVMPMDDTVQLKASGARRLLLAQPRALTPAQLVAIDRWVRDGGTALVLADPLLRWPSDLPLGDRRRAPPTSLLGPLLEHWGFAPSGVMEGSEIRHFLPDGQLITLSGVQRSGAALLHRQRIGQGAVLVLGDADPIDDRLWLADPAHPLDPRYWVADTPALVVRWLGGASIPGYRRWMRDAQDVTRALRWALLAGTIWAIVGAMLLHRGRRGATPGTKGEDGEAKDNKSG
ncbi:ABC transporter [Sphingobium sp. AR-3-1]|uniref:ABC transporter n=1 Tax=Sphingobium psychrophilum TaxID=2728834 RepID=A0A7X9ZUH5_9SPHN|nr:ABC transporter [Sphingobium psychrophilum]NML11349.1 ABC transporter [Sphingobium psychrophilum]